MYRERGGGGEREGERERRRWQAEIEVPPPLPKGSGREDRGVWGSQADRSFHGRENEGKADDTILRLASQGGRLPNSRLNRQGSLDLPDPWGLTKDKGVRKERSRKARRESRGGIIPGGTLRLVYILGQVQGQQH